MLISHALCFLAMYFLICQLFSLETRNSLAMSLTYVKYMYGCSCLLDLVVSILFMINLSNVSLNVRGQRSEASALFFGFILPR